MKIFTFFLTTNFNFLVLFTQICGLNYVFMRVYEPSFGVFESVSNKLFNISDDASYITREHISRCNVSMNAENTRSVRIQDTCSIRDNTRTTKTDDVIPKGDHCAQYYDYRSKSQVAFWEPHLHECSHPQLFDETSLSCRHYSLVECGHRFEPKDACEYMRHQCHGTHCIPCHFRYPSCRGFPDGLNAWPGKLYTPYFVVCTDERVVHQGRCDFHHRQRVFDPIGKACVTNE